MDRRRKTTSCSPISAPWVAQKIKRQHHHVDERLQGLGCVVVVAPGRPASCLARPQSSAAREWADLCSEGRSAPPRHQQMNPALWIFNPGKPGYLRILLAADLNVAGFGFNAWRGIWRSAWALPGRRVRLWQAQVSPLVRRLARGLRRQRYK